MSSEGKVICCSCHKPDDNMFLAVPRGGYADQPRRPICSPCYGDPDAIGEDGEVMSFDGFNDNALPTDYQCVFRLVEMPSPVPKDIVMYGKPSSEVMP